MKKKINIIIIALLIICTAKLKAQTQGPVILSSPTTTGVHNSNVKVTLATGFTSTAPFSATIVTLDCYTLSTTPTVTSNYVISNSPRVSGFTDESQLTGLNACQLMQTIQYVDGLGRPIQTIQVMASPFGYDMIQPQAYDSYGREAAKYLPYTPMTGTAGSLRPSATSAQQTFYSAPPDNVAAIPNANAATVFDNSPLNRPVEQGAPGNDWQPGQHTVKLDYSSNNNTTFTSDSVNSRQVALYTTSISSAGVQTLARAGNNATYTTGAITVTIAKDENWVSGRAGTMEEYKDIDGKVLLKRVYNYAAGVLQQLSTYYVYDDMGRLAFVLPPGASPDATAAISGTTLDNFCYQYRYDGLGRMMQKKLPGKGWEYTVYNNMDQPVATQDSLQHFNNQWIYVKYDAQGRAITTGIWTNGGTDITRTSLQTILNGISANLFETAQTTGTGYTNVAWPTSSTTPLTYSYYDSYANAPGLPTQFAAPPTGADLATRGQLVATKTAVLNTPADMLWGAHYYDYFGRSLTAYQQHYLGGALNAGNYDAISSTYDFTNAPTTTVRKHWNTTSATNPLVTITNTYYYDHAGRKLSSWEQIQNGASTPTTKTLLNKIDYNEIGQVKTKNLHSTDSVNFLQPVRYTYNERSWLLASTAGLFKMQLQYNTGANKQYNGNIAYQLWQTSGLAANTYTYTYDKLNRLTGGASIDNYRETGITYDVMGNISKLNRFEAGTRIDSLAYTYNGNALNTITDNSGSNSGLVSGATSYFFDGNGNLSSNTNSVNTQNKSYSYNLLNLPKVITLPTGTDTLTYDAGGQKLRKTSVIGGVTTNTDYIAGIQYTNSTTALDFIQTEEGRATPNGAGYDYQYYLGDNLGNTRVTFGTKTGSAVVYQKDDYYPFGLEINRTPPVANPKNEYLYNKKELQEELGQYDYGARFYDPVIGRWTTIDPLAEKGRRWSPYTYVANNPIRRIDPDGMADRVFDDKGNDYGYDENGKNGKIRIVTSSRDIETANKEKGAIKSGDLGSGIRTTEAVLKESSSVLKTTANNNGGTKEQLSIVNNKDGSVVRADINEGKTETSAEGTTVATTKVKTNTGAQYTSIHSHTTGEEDGKMGDALTIGPGDKQVFKMFGMNVVVGPLGSSATSTGAVFYDTAGDRKVQITNDTLNTILTKL